MGIMCFEEIEVHDYAIKDFKKRENEIVLKHAS